jgi:hypothetical protein
MVLKVVQQVSPTLLRVEESKKMGTNEGFFVDGTSRYVQRHTGKQEKMNGVVRDFPGWFGASKSGLEEK